MTCILVTGASGFVGRAVCERALSLGMKVKGTHRSVSSQSLVPAGVERIQVQTVDQDTDWSRALAGVEVVLHLAGRVHMAKDTAKDPLAIHREVNTAGTERLARMAIVAGVRRLVYVSTVKVNGEQSSNVPFTEADVPQPEDPYAISKWEAEQLLCRIGVETEMEVVILRPPLVYGIGVGANFLRLLHLVRRGVPLPLGSVSNRRSLIYVKNLADAILRTAIHPAAAGQTFLVSDGEDLSTPELIGRIANAMELTARVFRCPRHLLSVLGYLLGRSPEIRRLLSSLAVDCTKIYSETGWKPPYTMSQGLKETIEWYLAGEPLTREVSSASTAYFPRLGPTSKQ